MQQKIEFVVDRGMCGSGEEWCTQPVHSVEACCGRLNRQQRQNQEVRQWRQVVNVGA